jgi:hypothetical protein
MSTSLHTFAEEGNTGIDRMPPIDGMDSAGLVLTGEGRARCLAAVAGADALVKVLFQLSIDQPSIGGIKATDRTTGGLLQALAVCVEFLGGHIDGEGRAPSAQKVERDTADYAVLEALQERLRMA